MDRRGIIDALRRNEPALRALGLRHVALFGSFAQGTANDASDIDLLGTLDQDKRLSLLDVVHIENVLGDVLGRKVDFVDDESLDPRVAASVRQALIDAF